MAELFCLRVTEVVRDCLMLWGDVMWFLVWWIGWDSWICCDGGFVDFVGFGGFGEFVVKG